MSKKLYIKDDEVNTKKLVEELLAKADPSKIFGREGLFNQLKKQLIERILESELDHDLGYRHISNIGAKKSYKELYEQSFIK